jgi:drug/metabolite transporter (DMT)-like permease
MGILWCILGVIAFSGFYLLVDYSQKKGCEVLAINFVVFGVGTILALIAALPMKTGQFPMKLVWIGSTIGLTAGLGLLGIIMAMRSGIDVTIVNTIASLSLAVPILFSLFLYGEVPTLRKSLGLILAVISITFIQRGIK